MRGDSVIDKLQRKAKENETQRSEHIRGWEEEVKLLRRTKVEKELKKTHKGVLSIQLLVIKLSSHSSSSSKHAKGKAYNEKI
jgi:hypothetical protein